MVGIILTATAKSFAAGVAGMTIAGGGAAVSYLSFYA